MYSLMMFDSCSTRSRSTSTGTWLYGFITARSSGLWSRSTSMIWKSMPFLVQHDAAALAERVGRPGIKGHHGRYLLCCERHRGATMRAARALELWAGGSLLPGPEPLDGRETRPTLQPRLRYGASARPSSTRASSSTRRRTARRETAARRCPRWMRLLRAGSAM